MLAISPCWIKMGNPPTAPYSAYASASLSLYLVVLFMLYTIHHESRDAVPTRVFSSANLHPSEGIIAHQDRPGLWCSRPGIDHHRYLSRAGAHGARQHRRRPPVRRWRLVRHRLGRRHCGGRCRNRHRIGNWCQARPTRSGVTPNLVGRAWHRTARLMRSPAVPSPCAPQRRHPAHTRRRPLPRQIRH